LPQSCDEAKQQLASVYLAEVLAGPKHLGLSQEDPRGNRGAKKVLYRRIFRKLGLVTELVDHLIPLAILLQAIHFISKQVLAKP
jgi:hypothetical protein